MLQPQSNPVSEPDFTKVDRIAVSYTTGPLPPQYASWYEVVLTPDSVHYVGEAHGEQREAHRAITAEEFHRVLDAIRASGVRETESEYPQPIGGSSTTLYLYEGETCVLGGRMDARGTGTIRMEGKPTDIIAPYLPRL